MHEKLDEVGKNLWNTGLEPPEGIKEAGFSSGIENGKSNKNQEYTENSKVNEVALLGTKKSYKNKAMNGWCGIEAVWRRRGFLKIREICRFGSCVGPSHLRPPGVVAWQCARCAVLSCFGR